MKQYIKISSVANPWQEWSCWISESWLKALKRWLKPHKYADWSNTYCGSKQHKTTCTERQAAKKRIRPTSMGISLIQNRQWENDRQRLRDMFFLFFRTRDCISLPIKPVIVLQEQLKHQQKHDRKTFDDTRGCPRIGWWAAAHLSFPNPNRLIMVFPKNVHFGSFLGYPSFLDNLRQEWDTYQVDTTSLYIPLYSHIKCLVFYQSIIFFWWKMPPCIHPPHVRCIRCVPHLQAS